MPPGRGAIARRRGRRWPSSWAAPWPNGWTATTRSGTSRSARAWPGAAGPLCRIHHALADGASGTALLRVVYDMPDDAAPASVGVHGVHGVRGSRLRRLTGTAIDAGRGALALGTALVPVHGPSVTGPIRSGRRYAWTSVPRPRPDDRRRDLHVSVNDVALAAVTAGFRDSRATEGSSPIRGPSDPSSPSAWAGADVDEPDNRVNYSYWPTSL